MKNNPNLILIILIFAVIGCVGSKNESYQNTGNQPITQKTKSENVKPIFNAADLAGKKPEQVDKILGTPSDVWTERDTSRKMRSYSLGEDMTVEFTQNTIDSAVIFFEQKNVDAETAYSLVGLNKNAPQPNSTLSD